MGTSGLTMRMPVGTPLSAVSYDVRGRKLNGLVATVLQSPIYQLH